MTEHEQKRVTSLAQLDALPIGSIIAELRIPDSPAVDCRAVMGWQFLGDHPDRRYLSAELFSDNDSYALTYLIVLYSPEGVSA